MAHALRPVGLIELIERANMAFEANWASNAVPNAPCSKAIQAGLGPWRWGGWGPRDVIVVGSQGNTVGIWDAADALAATPHTLRRQRIHGPGAPPLLDLAPDGAGGYRITRATPDAWRYYIAQGRDAQGRLVTAPIETMFAKELRR